MRKISAIAFIPQVYVKRAIGELDKSLPDALFLRVPAAMSKGNKRL